MIETTHHPKVMLDGAEIDFDAAVNLMDDDLREHLHAEDWSPIECLSADGWSLHRPDATDEQIAAGDAQYILSGSGRPGPADYARASAQAFLDAYAIAHFAKFGEEFRVN